MCSAFYHFSFIIRQRFRLSQLQAMLNDMEVGDSIVTTGGFYGVVIDMTEEDVIVEFGNNKNCRIPMRKQAIAEVEKAGSVHFDSSCNFSCYSAYLQSIMYSQTVLTAAHTEELLCDPLIISVTFCMKSCFHAEQSD